LLATLFDPISNTFFQELKSIINVQATEQLVEPLQITSAVVVNQFLQAA
jgi:hypothetical protein